MDSSVQTTYVFLGLKKTYQKSETLVAIFLLFMYICVCLCESITCVGCQKVTRVSEVSVTGAGVKGSVYILLIIATRMPKTIIFYI